eukprot:COSAG02_NODE_51148_length_316_cov_0.635945_1_plen_61_part_01
MGATARSHELSLAGMAGVWCPVSAGPAAKIKGKYGVQPEDALGIFSSRRRHTGSSNVTGVQ